MGKLPPIYTIGHSDRSLDAFLALLVGADIAELADIRTMTASRANPQFNAATLAPALARRGIAYRHIAALGGLRPKARDIAPSVNGLWQNRSFHNYADYALSAPFETGLEELGTMADAAPTAMMCAEAVWWRCHRRIVADYFLARGRTVFHIMEKGRLVPAELTAGAVVRPDLTVVYPAADGPGDTIDHKA
ncbi:MAG: DUF488 domain-containing protein [Bauldia sp.]|jgi:uncharacterized protein (DUF488 family)|nr:DUF488 domain-containing protein [Bauldia sp.]